MFELRITTRRGSRREIVLRPESFVFPGGEVQVRADLPAEEIEALTISADLRSSDDVMALLLLADALRRQIGDAPISLDLPYVPYARQDRVCNPGEALAAKVFCTLINGLGFASVTILDPHSDVVPALLDRVHVVDASIPLSRVVAREEFRRGVTLLAPDGGSRKRVAGLARRLALPDVAYADKVRCTKSGEITAVAVPDTLLPQPVLVVDDICDGGRTFLELAQALRGVTDQPLYLYVTHGIFSKGVEVLLKDYQGIFTTRDWTASGNPAVTVISSGGQS
ncbi:MAG: ribose-phosphate pyrophosphokinase [Azonexus sp.]|nr:ribose-phosphate pyrophosphokinase [Betaproteobacteria bacterium]MBK8917259.1 ribose-phosphate pyrophosphokinase [Betaproteobacteria bacterium]MBP6035022.1 ribose-phosphate pyrophosphokinase [Azonexus sp.]MBP6906000.1 ribose-phosphate pyrophosphokinase [Azonexus sp.]